MQINLKNAKPRLLLVNPYIRTKRNYPSGYPPVGLSYISHMLQEAGFEHRVMDMGLGYSGSYLLKYIRQFKPDTVGFSMVSLRYNEVYGLISQVKKLTDVKIIVGGPHISCLGEEVLRDCPDIDIAILREGEETIKEICLGKDLKDIKGIIFRDHSKIISTAQRDFISDLDSLGFPKYEKFELKKYATKTISLITSRGCPYHCIFCPVTVTIGEKFRSRCAESVVEELAYWWRQGYREFAIQDDNFTLLPERVFKICEKIKSKGLKDLKLSLPNGVRADKIDRKLLLELKSVGLEFLCFGVEAGNDRILNILKKGQNIQMIEKAISLSLELGLGVGLFFLLGSPGETLSDLEDSFSLAKKYPVDYVEFYNIIPFPRTELFERMQNYGKFIEPYQKYLNKSEAFSSLACFETEELTLKQRIGAFKKARRIQKDIHLNFLKTRLKKFGILTYLMTIIYYQFGLQYITMQNKLLYKIFLFLRKKIF